MVGRGQQYPVQESVTGQCLKRVECLRPNMSPTLGDYRQMGARLLLDLKPGNEILTSAVTSRPVPGSAHQSGRKLEQNSNLGAT